MNSLNNLLHYPQNYRHFSNTPTTPTTTSSSTTTTTHHPHHLHHPRSHHIPIGPPSSHTSIESCPESSSSSSRTPSECIDTPFGTPKTNGGSGGGGGNASPLYSSSPKVAFFHRQHNHHHHSIQELIRHFGKRMQSWRSSDGGGGGGSGGGGGTYGRRNSCSVSEDKPKKDEGEFRGRSKSLDGQATRRRVIADCEATYRIYDSILREGTSIEENNYYLLEICVLCSIPFATSMVCIASKNGDNFRNFLNELSDYGNDSRPEKLTLYIKRANQFLLIFFKLSIPLFLIETLIVTLRDCESKTVDCYFLVSIYLPFDYSSNFIIRFLITCYLGALVWYGFVLGALGITMVVSGYYFVIVKMRHMRGSLMRIGEIENRNERLNYLILHMQMHDNIMSSVHQFSQLLMEFFINFLIISTISICILLYQAIHYLDFTAVLVLCNYLTALFLFSYIGQMLIEKHDLLRNDLFYCLPWDGDVQLAKYILFMIMRCDKPLTIPIGHYSTFSLPFMLQVFKMIYSLLMFLIRET